MDSMSIDFMCFAERYEKDHWICVGSGFFDSTHIWKRLVGGYVLPAILEERGLPENISEDVLGWLSDAVSPYCKTWVSLEELLNYNYEQIETYHDYAVGKLVTSTQWEALGVRYAEDLKKLQEWGAERIIIWLEN